MPPRWAAGLWKCLFLASVIQAAQGLKLLDQPEEQTRDGGDPIKAELIGSPNNPSSFLIYLPCGGDNVTHVATTSATSAIVVPSYGYTPVSCLLVAIDCNRSDTKITMDWGDSSQVFSRTTTSAGPMTPSSQSSTSTKPSTLSSTAQQASDTLKSYCE